MDGTDGETIEMDPSVLSTEKGWAYVTVYPHSNCEGAEYSVGGIMTGTCLPIYSESTTDDANNAKSVMYGCEGGKRKSTSTSFSDFWTKLTRCPPSLCDTFRLNNPA